MDQFCSIPAQQFNSNRFYYPHSAQQRATVAVSACLMGQRVRYDGNDRYLPAIEELTTLLQLIPICPEVGAGLTVPRPPVQLVATSTSIIQARGRDNPNLDVTSQLQMFAQTSATQFNATPILCGYLWKSRSPSCGYGSTPLFDQSGRQIGTTSGIHAAHFQREFPWLSYCEEATLLDQSAVLAFVLRCRIVFDWMYAGGATELSTELATARPTKVSAEISAQHRHYAFLIDRLSRSDQASLEQLAATRSRSDYLIALQQSCTRLPAEQLLDLFFN
jgi:uncharacterized protein YbbK (DUF523 family)